MDQEKIYPKQIRGNVTSIVQVSNESDVANLNLSKVRIPGGPD